MCCVLLTHARSSYAHLDFKLSYRYYGLVNLRNSGLSTHLYYIPSESRYLSTITPSNLPPVIIRQLKLRRTVRWEQLVRLRLAHE